MYYITSLDELVNPTDRFFDKLYTHWDFIFLKILQVVTRIS